jgi:hypothetical protein
MFVLANIGYFEEKPDPAIRYHQLWTYRFKLLTCIDNLTFELHIFNFFLLLNVVFSILKNLTFPVTGKKPWKDCEDQPSRTPIQMLSTKTWKIWSTADPGLDRNSQFGNLFCFY